MTLSLAKSILLKHYKSVNNKSFKENNSGPAKSMIKVSQSTKRGFSQKALGEIETFSWFWHRINPLKAWNVELEADIFLAI